MRAIKPYTRPVAVSPTIPTSFVPKQPLDAPRRKMQAGDNIFLVISIVVLAVSLVTALAVFGYDKYLSSVIEVKSAALEEARNELDQQKVEDFIRLKDRFASGRQLLDDHVAASRFFTLLETATLQNVQYSSLELAIADDRTASVTLSGLARNFNTLAAQSNEIAKYREVKRAIFSEITIAPNGLVGFTLTATVDPSLVRMPEVNAAPAATTTEATAPVATTTVPTATTTPARATTTPSL